MTKARKLNRQQKTRRQSLVAMNAPVLVQTALVSRKWCLIQREACVLHMKVQPVVCGKRRRRDVHLVGERLRPRQSYFFAAPFSAPLANASSTKSVVENKATVTFSFGDWRPLWNSEIREVRKAQ